MQKYWQVVSIEWQNGFVYRISLFFWRLRQFLGVLMSLTIWQVLFTDQSSILNYSRQEMITYVFLVSLLQSALLTTAHHGLANTIYSGDFSKVLIKPINVFGYLAAIDVADKAKNISFALVEMTILAFIFQPVIPLPTVLNALLFVLSIGMGVSLYFIIILLFGSLGFWSPETWAPRFLFFMFLDFTAGKLYPLDILPQVIQQVVYLTPFPYLSYLQTQIFLGRMPIAEILNGILVMSGWILGLWAINRWIWKQGFKNYSAAGL